MGEFEWLYGLACVFGVLAVVVIAFKAATGARSGQRIEVVERRVMELLVRVATLEKELAGRAPAIVAQPQTPTPAPVTPSLPPAETAPAATDRPPPLPPFPQRARPETPVESAPVHRAEPSFESFVGGRVMLVVGIVVVLFGVGFFLKFAIDRGWIGPEARIGMGVALGAALLVGGDVMRRRGFEVFGQALMGGGLGALYLSNYFACTKYAFIGHPTAIALTGVLTAIGATLAIARKAPFLAYLGFLGGYLAPAILGEPTGDLVPLTSWMLLVDAGAAAVLFFRAWHGLDVMAFVMTSLYVGAWLDEFGRRADLTRTVLCVAALVAASLFLSLVPSLVRRRRPTGLSLGAVAMAAALGTIAAHWLLFPAHRVALGIGVVALALACLVASRLLARRVESAGREVESLLGISVAALATAILVVASGSAVAPTLSVAGVAVVFAGTRTRHPVLMTGGVLVIAAAFVDLLAYRTHLFAEPMRAFLNERVLLFACPCVAMLVAQHLLARREGADRDPSALVGAVGLLALPIVLATDLWIAFGRSQGRDELRWVAALVLLSGYGFCAARFWGRDSSVGRRIALVPIFGALVFGAFLFFFGHEMAFALFGNPTFAAGIVLAASVWFAAGADEPDARPLLRIAAVVYLFVLVTCELGAWGRLTPLEGLTRAEAEFRAQVWISIAWALYGAALVVSGFLGKSAGLRWCGLAVFALTLGKVFLVDMAGLEAVYRIGSFLVLGALLVAASFLYQRSRAGVEGD